MTKLAGSQVSDRCPLGYLYFVIQVASNRITQSLTELPHQFFWDYIFLILYLTPNQRVTLFRSTRFVHPLSIDKVLFGDSNISIEENISLFKAVHQYIKDTRRFSAN